MKTTTFEEMKSGWNKQKKWEKKHPVLSVIKDMRWWPYRLWSRSGDNYRRFVKWPIQRAVRGYDDTAFWGLDSYIVDIALPVLKYYKKNKSGIPYLEGHDDRKWKENVARWNKILNAVILSFELQKKDRYCTLEQSIENDKKIQEGLELFGKHFRSFWD